MSESQNFGMTLDASGYHVIHAAGCARLTAAENRSDNDAAYYETISEAVADAARTVGGFGPGREYEDEAAILRRVVQIHPCTGKGAR
jgi:hypothetical protein